MDRELIAALKIIKILYFKGEINETTYIKIRKKYPKCIDILPLKGLTENDNIE